MTPLRRLLRDESGIALIVVIGILGVLTITGISVVTYTSSNTRTAEYSKDSSIAYDLAEAGINQALAVLKNPGNNPLNTNLLPATTTTLAEGSVTWQGTFDPDSANNFANPSWTLTATGAMTNPTGSDTPVRRTITAKVPVTVQTTGTLTYGAWNYVYTSNVSPGCDTILDQSINFQSPLYVSGNLCMNTPSQISAGPLVVHGSVRLDQNTNIGTSASPINSIEIGGETSISGSPTITGCRFKTEAVHSPCKNGSPPNPATRNGDEIWMQGLAQSTTTTEVNIPAPGAPLPRPVADFVSWYTLASPGPASPCTTSAGTPPNGTGSWATGFDNDYGTAGNPNRSAPLFDLVPTYSYSCKTAGGELSWDNTTQKLTIRGIVFIDGHAKINRNINVEYDGYGALYLSGTFQLQNARFCAVFSGSNCDWSGWDPATDLLAIVADGNNGPSPMPPNDSIFLRSTQWQGAIYATNLIEFDSTTQTQGPMIGDTIVNGNTVITRPFATPLNVPFGLPGQTVVSPAVVGTPQIFPN